MLPQGPSPAWVWRGRGFPSKLATPCPGLAAQRCRLSSETGKRGWCHLPRRRQLRTAGSGATPGAEEGAGRRREGLPAEAGSTGVPGWQAEETLGRGPGGGQGRLAWPPCPGKPPNDLSRAHSDPGAGTRNCEKHLWAPAREAWPGPEGVWSALPGSAVADSNPGAPLQEQGHSPHPFPGLNPIGSPHSWGQGRGQGRPRRSVPCPTAQPVQGRPEPYSPDQAGREIPRLQASSHSRGAAAPQCLGLEIQCAVTRPGARAAPPSPTPTGRASRLSRPSWKGATSPRPAGRGQGPERPTAGLGPGLLPPWTTPRASTVWPTLIPNSARDRGAVATAW